MRKGSLGFLLVLLGVSPGIFAQNNYSNYAQQSSRIAALAKNYPQWVKTKSLTKTTGGKEIWQITIGPANADKQPAIAILGGVEGTYLLGTELVIGFAENLLQGINSDSVKSLLNKTTFYIFPNLSPDAMEQYFASLQYERRGNANATDDDRDGKQNEDGYDDLDGDGKITWMRIESPIGEYRVHPDDPRIMIKADAAKGEKGKYLLISEGRDNDKDGQFNEDGEGGVWFDKNLTYKHPSFTPGAGEFAVSENENRALLDNLFEMFNVYAVVMFGSNNNLSTPVTYTAAAANQRIVVPQAEPTGAAPLTRENVEAWLDGYLPYALQTGDIAGAVVVVVKDGQVLVQKGYGYSDVKTRKPVDPELTLFRPGSISKLFTWTAVMQQVERGKLDLDADVNKYLDFQIPPREGQPVTLRNIMTHTAGFEEQLKGLMGEAGGKAVKPFDERLKAWVPERIFAPGTTPAYSNYATALAGYIVQRVSGVPFDDYIEQNIFAPLGMRHSSFRQPLPESLEPLMSSGYELASSSEAKPYEIVGVSPAGSLAAPGADMAKFMIAHLQNGAFGSARILREDTARQMHSTALTILPRVQRMLLGFYEQNYNGHRAVGHGGDTNWFHSDLHLFIDDGVGMYISLNSAGKGPAAHQIRGTLFDQFADRYLPGATLDGKVDETTAAEHARMMAGVYENSRRIDSSFFKLLGLAGPIKIVPNQDHTISVSMAQNLAGAPIKWREVEPFVYRDADGKSLLSAQVKDGRVVRFSFDGVSPFMMFDRTPASRSPSWLLPAAIFGLSSLLLTCLAWPVSALVRRHYGVAYGLAGEDAKAHRWVRIAATAAVVICIGWAITIGKLMGNLALLSESSDAWLWLMQLLSLVVFIGGAILGAWNAWVVVRSPRKWYAKVWAVAVALSLLLLLYVALTFHLIAFDANY